MSRSLKKGPFVDTSLLEAALSLTVWESTEYWVTGRAPRPLGSAHRLAAPYQALRASDGWFTVGANNDRLFEAFCRAIERPELAVDTRFAAAGDRLRHRDALIAEIEKTTTAEPRAHWLERLDAVVAESVGAAPNHDVAVLEPEALWARFSGRASEQEDGG